MSLLDILPLAHFCFKVLDRGTSLGGGCVSALSIRRISDLRGVLVLELGWVLEAAWDSPISARSIRLLRLPLVASAAWACNRSKHIVAIMQR